MVMASEAIGYFGAPNPVAGGGPSPLAAHFCPCSEDGLVLPEMPDSGNIFDCALA